MNVLKTFDSEKQHEQHTVTINTGAVVAIDGEPVHTPREEALGWTILRFNAQNIYLREDVEKARVEMEAMFKKYQEALQKSLDLIH